MTQHQYYKPSRLIGLVKRLSCLPNNQIRVQPARRESDKISESSHTRAALLFLIARGGIIADLIRSPKAQLYSAMVSISQCKR